MSCKSSSFTTGPLAPVLYSSDRRPTSRSAVATMSLSRSAAWTVEASTKLSACSSTRRRLSRANMKNDSSTKAASTATTAASTSSFLLLRMPPLSRSVPAPM